MGRGRSREAGLPGELAGPTQTYVDLAHRRAQPPLSVLVRASGVQASPETFRLSSGICAVGTGQHNDITLHDSSVSRSHLELSLVPEGVLMCDRGSRNGTYYLGQRVEKIVLSLGSRITLGRATLTVEADAESLAHVDAYNEPEFMGIVGSSAVMRKLFATIARMQGSLVPVIIEGQSGVGKELVARALHLTSPASSAPFVAINCGALVRELVASELFGHQKGAFTGAMAPRKGAFESADGGTLFLDEIGELPADVQPMLLRVLERGEVQALGSDAARPVKVRVIGATNRDLRAEVTAGRFREDLFYRLAVVRLRVPSLSERAEDIGLLARRFARELGLGELDSAVVRELQTRAWPGNVRELRNAMQAYAVLGELPARMEGPPDLLESALAQLAESGAPYLGQKDALLDRFTRIYLRIVLARAGGNQTAAAQLAGLDRTYLGRLMARVAEQAEPAKKPAAAGGKK
ncbi:MAG: sigma 54-dependent Fis family transcriptional regulator [Deltaproteobacteria bacterium]|nr:sigma 54-dependent Fis family transcriptional regulator [Deltaproteobacteria bacterium]